MSRSTSSTADSQLEGRPKTSRSTGKLFVSPRTETSAASAERGRVVAAKLTVSVARLQAGVGLGAARDPVRAARVEAARGGNLRELGHPSGNDRQLAAAACEPGHRAQQSLRVGM